MLQKLLLTIAIILLAFVPQFLRGAGNEIKRLWKMKPVETILPEVKKRKRAPRKKSSPAPKKRARKPKAKPTEIPAGTTSDSMGISK